jgi:hypothetical protein
MMKALKTALIAFAGLASANAMAVEYTMTCEEALTRLDLEVTDEARERLGELEGACMGVVERDGELYMHTEMIVRRVRGSTLTMYLPATDHTFQVKPDFNQRVQIGNSRVRARDLNSGQSLNLYVPINAITQPVIRQIAFEEDESLVVAPATAVAALPTTG